METELQKKTQFSVLLNLWTQIHSPSRNLIHYGSLKIYFFRELCKARRQGKLSKKAALMGSFRGGEAAGAIPPPGLLGWSHWGLGRGWGMWWAEGGDSQESSQAWVAPPLPRPQRSHWELDSSFPVYVNKDTENLEKEVLFE